MSEANRRYYNHEMLTRRVRVSARSLLHTLPRRQPEVRSRRHLATLLVIVLLLGLAAGAPPAAAGSAPPRAAVGADVNDNQLFCPQHTYGSQPPPGPIECYGRTKKYTTTAGVRSWQLHHATGPTANTWYGRAEIIGFHWTSGSNVAMAAASPAGWLRDLAFTDHSPARSSSAAAAAGCSWWNVVGCYLWTYILGDTVRGWVEDCLAGAFTGVVGTATGQLVTNLITKGAKIAIGPAGYAGLAIGSCFANVVSFP